MDRKVPAAVRVSSRMSHTRFLLVLISLSVFSAPTSPADTEPSLGQRLEEMKEAFAARAPEERKQAYAEGIEAVAKSGIVEKAIRTGDEAPDFTLSNATNEKVSLSEKLEDGPVVLMWYRGGWCPYCNLQLRAMQEVLPKIEAAGGRLIALTPELPDKSLSTVEKNELKFDVLTDAGQEVARDYGLVFELTPEVTGYYQEHFDLKEYNGAEAADNELPLAATYVIDTDGKVAWHFLDADYRQRAEPSEVIEALKKLDQ